MRRPPALRRFAEAEKPLYQSLDAAQKRRLGLALRFAARQHIAGRAHRAAARVH
jgi:hypothetical protein